MVNDWRRLSVFAIAFFTIQRLRQLINLYPALIGAAFTARQFELTMIEVSFYLLCAAIVLLLSASLAWLNFYYVLKNNTVCIRSGVFRKEQLALSFDRIQSVSIKEPFYYRPFGLVILSMDGAGSSKSEVNIAALTRVDAEGLKTAIQAYSQKNMSNSMSSSLSNSAGEAVIEDEQVTGIVMGDIGSDGDRAANTGEHAGEEKNGELLIERGLRDLIIYGFTRNRAWIILAFIWPLFEHLERSVYSVTDNLGVDLSAWLDTQASLALAAIAALLLVGLIVLTSLLSIASSIFSLAHYRLSYHRGSYQRNSGLVNKYEIKVKRSRIQSIVYQKNWLDVIFRRSVMTMEPFSSSAFQGSMDAFMQKIHVPSITDDEFNRLAAHAYSGFQLQGDGFTRISRLFILRKFTTYAVALGALVSGAVLLTKDDAYFAWMLLLVLILPLVIQRWRRYGWKSVGDYMVVRTGFIGTAYVCFPRYKIQQAQFHQSLMLERRRLASVVLVLASGSVILPLIKEADARRIIDGAIADAEFSGRSWM